MIIQEEKAHEVEAILWKIALHNQRFDKLASLTLSFKVLSIYILCV
jgi:hypothetical protein